MTPVPDVLRLDMNNSLECVSINITNDVIVEGTEMFAVQFVETDDNEIMIRGHDTIPVFIVDDEVVVLEFAKQIYNFSEDSATNDPSINVVIVNYNQLVIIDTVYATVSALDGNTTDEDDYTLFQFNGEVKILVGMESGSFSLEVMDDTLVEGVEELALVLASGRVHRLFPSNVDFENTQATVYIHDNDDATIGFTSTSYTTPEGEFDVCVTLMNGTLQDNVMLSYSVSVSNTTASDIDFFQLSQQEQKGVISRNNPVYCHALTIKDDTIVESDEELQAILEMEFNTASVFFSPDSATITIADADRVLVDFQFSSYSQNEGAGAPTVSVSLLREDGLTSDHSFTIRLGLSPASTAMNGTDFDIIDGPTQVIVFEATQPSENINLIIANDDIAEGNENIVLVLDTSVDSNVISVGSNQDTTVITIIEDDFIDVSFTETVYSVGEGEAVEVCVEIITSDIILPPNGMVDVVVSTDATISTAGVDYEPTVTPASGTLDSNTDRTCFMITTLEDTLVEGTEEIVVRYSFTNQFGSFEKVDNGESIIAIVDDDYFEIGFERSDYEIGEEEGAVSDEVYIVKMNDNTLLTDYTLTIAVNHSFGDFPAVLGDDFEVDGEPPLMVTFRINDTDIPVSLTFLNDPAEEGYEYFTLQLSHEEPDETVQIVTSSALISIKDDDGWYWSFFNLCLDNHYPPATIKQCGLVFTSVFVLFLPVLVIV
jgi:hypothetical protein